MASSRSANCGFDNTKGGDSDPRASTIKNLPSSNWTVEHCLNFSDRLLEWHELLPWQRDNEYILTSHRQPSFSYVRSLKSVLSIHNETINIWSHMFGAIGFCVMTSVLYQHRSFYDSRETEGDSLAILTYFSCVVICFTCSFIFHIFLDHSHHVRTIACGFDYLGIVVPLWGTTVSSTHFGFRDEPALQEFYWIIASVPATLCAATTLLPVFSGPKGRRIRTSAYLALGLSSFLPIVHGIMLYGLEWHDQRMSLRYYMGLGLCQGTGMVLYAARIPQRLYPRRFDIWGSSHQLMHILVVCGAVCYGVGILKAEAHWRRLSSTTLTSM